MQIAQDISFQPFWFGLEAKVGEKQWEASIDVNRNPLHFFIKDITINIVFVDNITLAVKY